MAGKTLNTTAETTTPGSTVGGFVLSPEQQKVVNHRGGHLQVIACAGAGKTEAISRTVPAMPKIEYSYSPRRPPVLRFDPTGKADQLPELLDKATKAPLTKEEAQILADALRTQQPWLEWAGKQEAESKGFTVDPLALHIHERISSQAILKVAARQGIERTLFSDPEQEYHEAVQFYKHDIDWTNRLILGDSAQVMASLAHREDLAGKLMDKQRKEGKRAITDADKRRWELPKKGEKFEHWTVPFDTDPDWPKELQHAVTEYRKVWRAKMDEVNACIAANAAQEELVDQPEVVKGIVRVSGPFTVEAVQPPERSLGALEGMFDGAPRELEDSFDMKNVESYLDQMTRLLKLDGVRFPNNKEMAFGRLERLVGQSGGLHAEGRWMPKGETDDDPEGQANVAVGFGPQYGPVTAKQVEDLIRSASRRGYDALVVAGFSFDGPAQAAIEESQHPKLRIHMASIRPDINPGMAGLLKEQPGSQLFTVFGQPRTLLKGPDKRGDYVVHMEGVDIYDPVANTIRSTEDSKVAAWFVDGDYDGRTFCMTQAFFPDKSAWSKLAKALGGVVSEDAFEKLSGTISLPFPAGKHKCVAVKVIDPRGNEVMQVHRIG